MEDDNKESKILNLLSVLTNRIILQKLSGRSMTVMELFSELKKDPRIKIKNRESVYKDLEKMKLVGILDKSYDETEKNLYYNVKMKSVLIDLKNGDIKFS